MRLLSSPSLIEASQELQDYVVDLRRELHKIPELGFQEEKTLAFIKNEILEIAKSSHYPLTIVEKFGGIWVDLVIDPYFDFLLFRADVDALPIQENTGLSYQSQHPGLMHACGHDCHSAMLLGALRILSHDITKSSSNIRFVWQRAEELGNVKSGGAHLVEEGVCRGMKSVFALHISSTLEAGLFKSRPGIMMANSTHVKVGISCTGGHVMNPHFGSSAIDILTDIHVSLRGYDLRVFGPHEVMSFIPSISKAGVTSNIYPNFGETTYAIRNFLSPERLEDFIRRIKDRIENVIRNYDMAELKEFSVFNGFPILKNELHAYSKTKVMLQNSGFAAIECLPMLSGEDFAFYLREKPGSFWCLGAKQGPGHDHHTAEFNPDEAYLWQGVAFWLLLASRY